MIRLRNCLFALVVMVALLQGLPGRGATYVYFEDLYLETAVRNALLKPVGTITSAEMAELQYLNAAPGLRFTYIDELGGLETATNLIDLNLQNNDITNVVALAPMRRLTSLNLSDNLITDLTPLADLPLEVLYLRNNRVKNISVLTNLAELIFVDLRGNLLDISAGSAAMATIDVLLTRGVILVFEPQNTPPVLQDFPDTSGYVNTSKEIVVTATDRETPAAQLQLQVASSNPGIEASISRNSRSLLSSLYIQDTAGTTGQTVLTITVTDRQGTSTSNSFVFTVLPDYELHFPDPHLEEEVRTSFSPRLEGAIMASKVSSLDYLSLYSGDVTDLTGLEHAQTVKTLYVNGGALTNIAALGEMNLERVRFYYTGLSNAHLMIFPPSLTDLSIVAGGLSRVDFLEGLPLLQSLDLSRNFITNYAGLGHLTRLTSLNLSEMSISNLVLLPAISGLESLRLSYNNVMSLDGLSGFPALTSLFLEGNLITNFAGLIHVPNLTYLDISRTGLRNVTTLNNLSNLLTLDLDYNPITNVHQLGLPTLKTLTLNGVFLGATPSLPVAPRLVMLEAQSCSLRNGTLLEGYPLLQSLNLALNSLTNVNFLSGLTNLMTLTLRDNLLPAATVFPALPRLTILDVEGNKLNRCGSFSNLAVLEHLFAEFNQFESLTGLPPVTFRQLALDGNRLTNVNALATNAFSSFSAVSVAGNMLDLSPGSEAMLVIQGLTNREVRVYYLPQRTRLTPGSVERASDGSVVVSFPSEPGNAYYVQASENLSSWFFLGYSFTATNEVSRVQDHEAKGRPRRFYRIGQYIPTQIFNPPIFVPMADGPYIIPPRAVRVGLTLADTTEGQE